MGDRTRNVDRSNLTVCTIVRRVCEGEGVVNEHGVRDSVQGCQGAKSM